MHEILHHLYPKEDLKKELRQDDKKVYTVYDPEEFVVIDWSESFPSYWCDLMDRNGFGKYWSMIIFACIILCMWVCIIIYGDVS